MKFPLKLRIRNRWRRLRGKPSIAVAVNRSHIEPAWRIKGKVSIDPDGRPRFTKVD